MQDTRGTKDDSIKKLIIKNLAAEKSAEKLRAIMDNFNVGVSVAAYGNDGLVSLAYANDCYYGIFGYTEEQFRSELHDAHEIILPEDADYVRSAIGAIKQTGKPDIFRCRVRRRDGKIICVSCNSSVMAIEGIGDRVLLSIITDITDSVESEKKL